MSKQMIISVMSKDRPGIIADITGAIFDLDGDLADLNQSVLFGYLTMILVATFDDKVTAEDVIAKISHIETQIKFEVSIKELDEHIDTAALKLPGDTYIVTAQGKNKSGLVHSISQFCYNHHINILDLVTTKTADRYTMILQLDLSKVEAIIEVRKALQSYAEESGLHVVMQHHDLFKVTNEITF